MARKIRVPNDLASDLEEIGRHFCEGEDIDQERTTVLRYLADMYIDQYEEDFSEKEGGQIIYVG